MDASPVVPLVFGVWGSLFLALGIAAVRGADWIERAATQRVGFQRWVRRGREPRVGVETNIAMTKFVLFGVAAMSYAALIVWIVQAIRGELQ